MNLTETEFETSYGPQYRSHSCHNEKQQIEHHTTDNIRKKITREKESEDQRKARLAYQQKRSASTRSNESIEKRDSRLSKHRKRLAVNRSRESVEQRKSRLTEQQKQVAAKRFSESVEQRKARLIEQRKRSAANRLNKSVGRKAPLLTQKSHDSEVAESIVRKQHTATQAPSANIRYHRASMEKNQRALLEQYRWPSAIPTPLKEYCLQDFCNHMSMTTLQQYVCIICNIRTPANRMKEYALKNIPNLEKLSCHADLIDIIHKTQQTTQGVNSNCVITQKYSSFFW